MSVPSQQITAGLLEAYPWGRIRRNHGLEHATLHILAQRFPHRAMAGHSGTDGFWILAEVSQEDVRSAADEALERLRRGERHLAVHPNCGTNLVTAGVLAGLSGAAAMFGAGPRWRDKLDRFPVAAVLATLALMVSQPVGSYLQTNLTTSGDPGRMSIVEIKPARRGKWHAYRVITRDEP